MRFWTTCFLLLTCWLATPAQAGGDVLPAGSPIRLGLSTPLSGPNAAYGQDMRDAIAAYFNQVNSTGGIHGRKIELFSLDDGYETERTLSNTRQLIQEQQVFALLGFYGTNPTTEAMNTVFGPAHIPLIGTISGAASLRQPPSKNQNCRYLFNVRASYADETDAIITQLVSLGLKNIAVFYQNDGFGTSGLEGVTAALKKYNLTPAAVGTVERNSVDVQAAVASIAKAKPQAVVMITLYKPTAAFVKAIRQAGQSPMMMTLSSVGADQLVQELGSEARGIGISQVMPFPWNDTLPIVRDYHRLAGKSGKFSYYGIEGYITARVLADALQKAGKELSREKLISTLESMTSHDIGGYRLNYGPDNRTGSRFVELTVIGPGGKVLK